MSRPINLIPVVAIAAAWWLFIDLTAVWGPSLITIFGQAAATPAELMGLYALGCVLAAYVVLALARRLPWLALAIALGARVVLAFGPGDQIQLWVSSVGVAGVLAWLGLLVARSGRYVAPGVALGWLAHATAAAAGGTWLAVWRTDLFGLLCLAVLVAAALTTASAARPTSQHQVTPLQAWSLLPIGVVAGIALVNPGRASSISPDLGPLLLVVGCCLALAIAYLHLTRPVRIGLGLVGVAATAASLYAIGTVDGVPQSLMPWVLTAFVVGPAGLVALLTPAAESTRRAGRAVEVVGGGIVWALLFFAYYAGYDLGYRADGAIVVTSLVLVVLAARRDSTERSTFPGALVASLSATALLIAGLGAVVQRVPSEVVATSSPAVKVVAYNVRMGYGMDGRFVPRDVVDVIEGADVVLLEEVDRGWLLNGGQDQLAVLARLSGMRLYFAPAGDSIWGDAILTRLPVTEVRGHPLPSYDAVTGAGLLAVNLTVAEQPLWMIVTHVQPTNAREDGTIDQTGDITEFAAALASDGTPIVMGGDFNFEPDSASFAAILAAGFTDTFAEQRPVFTSDSLDPVKQIDHLFVSGPITVDDAGVTHSTASDHLPIWASLSVG